MGQFLQNKESAVYCPDTTGDNVQSYEIVTNKDNMRFMVTIHRQNADSSQVDVVYEDGDLIINYADDKCAILPDFPKEKLKQALEENALLITETNEEGIQDAYIIKFH